MSGSNKGKLTKGKGAVDTVLSAGCWTGRSMSFKNGPGVPSKKKRRKVWYEGNPQIKVGNDTSISTRYSHKQSV